MSSTLINFRVDEKLKTESQKILKELGVSTSDLMKHTLQYVVENKKLPVSLKIVDNEAKQIIATDIGFQEINEKIIGNKNTFIYSRIGAGASSLIGDCIIQMIKNGNGVIISNYLLNNRLFLEDMAETANSCNREIKTLQLKSGSTSNSEFEYGLNPILGESVETIIHFILGYSISEVQKSFLYSFIDTFKSITPFKNLLELNDAIQATNLESYGFSETELESITALTNKIQLINNSDFSQIFNNLNEERNISFREVLSRNELLIIDSDFFLKSESYTLAKELISNLFDFAIQNSSNENNTNYAICSDTTVFLQKSILKNIAISRKFNLNYIYQSVGFKKTPKDNEVEYLINTNCHYKVICGHPDIMIDHDHLKTFFGANVMDFITSEFKNGILLNNENKEYHYYS